MSTFVGILSIAMPRSLTHHIKAAHTVVIRGVKLFQNNANVEYSDLDVMQMIGRAVRTWFPYTSSVLNFLSFQGRPQFGESFVCFLFFLT